MIKDNVIKRFIELSLNPVPVRLGTKEPNRKGFTEKMESTDRSLYNFEEVGISTGYSSLNLEVLDFDLDKTEDPVAFMKAYNKMVPKDLHKKLVKQNTPKGGQHYVYRCPKIESNQKLARNKKGEATIETRGIGGYIKCYPSEGYTMVEGNTWSDVTTITEEERELLFIIARQQDELLKRDVSKRYSAEDIESFKKFRKYNEDYQLGIDLLEDAGWTYHSTNGDWYNLSKPDSNSGDLHGGYNREDLFFQCFSTAQDTFEERRGYNNHHLHAELECGGNYRKAYAKLFEQGYGEENDSDDDYEDELDFISSGEDEDEYLEQARKGEIPLGVTLGWSSLDDTFRLKKNTFVFLLGLDNIGKSTLTASFMVASNILHGYKWGVSSPESLVTATRRDLLEAESGKDVDSYNSKPLAYQALLQNNRKSFFIFKNDKHSTIDDILKRGKKLYQKHGIDFLLIDPFSFYSGSGNYSEDTEILSKIRVFCQNYCSVIVVDHPYTGFTRTAKDEQGFITMPTKYDAAGGNAKANRTDDFISAHRIINHDDSTVRRTMQISIQKVKDKKTGGKPNVDGEYTSLIWETRDGFTGYWDDNGDNPMYKAIKARLGVENISNIKATPVSLEEAF
tara:strand:- start:2757 stop:4619 length:1863 start_codon:yes stop_codon:yes gene_type:complete